MDATLSDKKEYILNFFKGLFSSLCVSLILILIFAFTLKYISVNDGTIKIINQIIKIVSIFYGVKVVRKKDAYSTFFKGLILGVFYGLSTYLIFSLLSGGITFNLTTLNDIVFNGGIGGIVGLLYTLLNKKVP